MLDKTKTRISDLLRKSVGLPASDSSCCNPVSQGVVETETRHDAEKGSRLEGTTAKSCCGGGAKFEKEGLGRGDRS